MGTIHLVWGANPANEAVVKYYVERRPLKVVGGDPTYPHINRLARQWRHVVSGDFIRIAEVDGTSFEDTAQVKHARFFKRWVRPKFLSKDPIELNPGYEYRIAAVNAGGRSDWQTVTVIVMVAPVITSINHGRDVPLNHAVDVDGNYFNHVTSHDVFDALGKVVNSSSYKLDVTDSAHATLTILNLPLGVYTLVMRAPGGQAQHQFRMQGTRGVTWSPEVLHVDKQRGTMQGIIHEV